MRLFLDLLQVRIILAFPLLKNSASSIDIVSSGSSILVTKFTLILTKKRGNLVVEPALWTVRKEQPEAMKIVEGRVPFIKPGIRALKADARDNGHLPCG